MYSLGIDTSHQFLLLALMNDKGTVDTICMDCMKKQSEFIIVKIDELLKRNQLEINDIQNIVVTLGPGSYTGVRIGLTVAKVLGSIVGKNVFTLSTLQLYAGIKKCFVLIDARANRCYFGHYDNGKAIEQDDVKENSVIQQLLDKEEILIGDLHLFNKEDNYPDLANNFYLLKDYWQAVSNIDILTPIYLKNREEYLKR